MARWVWNTIDFGAPLREMLKLQVPVDIYAHTFLGALSESSVYSLARDVVPVLPRKRWGLCLEVTETWRQQKAGKCPGFPCTLTAKQNALSRCSFFSVILSCSFRPMGGLHACWHHEPASSLQLPLQFVFFFKLKWRLVSCLKEPIAFPAESRCWHVIKRAAGWWWMRPAPTGLSSPWPCSTFEVSYCVSRSRNLLC